MPEVLLRPDLGKKPYRLKCRFVIGDHPRPDLLERFAKQTAERWVVDMHKQGWEFVPRYRFRITGPYPKTETVTIRRQAPLSARAIIHQVVEGNRFLPKEDSPARMVIPVEFSDAWEYEISAVFVHKTILTEVE